MPAFILCKPGVKFVAMKSKGESPICLIQDAMGRYRRTKKLGISSDQGETLSFFAYGRECANAQAALSWL